MFLSRDFRRKAVININDAEILGYVRDIELNCENGVIEAIIIPGRFRFIRFITGSGDHVISWDKIIKIGRKIVIVDY